MSRPLQDRLDVLIADMEIDSQRVMRSVPRGTPEHWLAAEIYAHIVEYRRAKNLPPLDLPALDEDDEP